jgi:uncharacterized protein (TIGR00730 family)
MKTICVFCGSSTGNDPVYAKSARLMGQAMADRDMSLVYGGSATGMMGTIADAMLASSKEVIGVIPRALATREKAHPNVTTMHMVSSMHERKALMAKLCDGFIAMPGGMGTLEELCEVITWAQLGIHSRPIGLLNTAGYFDGFVAFFEHMVANGFVPSYHRRLIIVEAEPDKLLDEMAAYQHPGGGVWMDWTET